LRTTVADRSASGLGQPSGAPRSGAAPVRPRSMAWDPAIRSRSANLLYVVLGRQGQFQRNLDGHVVIPHSRDMDAAGSGRVREAVDDSVGGWDGLYRCPGCFERSLMGRQSGSTFNSWQTGRRVDCNRSTGGVSGRRRIRRRDYLDWRGFGTTHFALGIRADGSGARAYVAESK